MPTLTKQYTLTVTVEQFLNACNEIELQELELLLPRYLDRKDREKKNIRNNDIKNIND